MCFHEQRLSSRFKHEKRRDKSVIRNENLPGYRKKSLEDGRNLLPRKNKVENDQI